MKISITNDYRQRLEELSGKLKKYTPLFDFNSALEFTCERKKNSIFITYKTAYMQEEYTSAPKKIKKCKIYSDGCLIIFKDKKFIFLPVTNNEETDGALVAFCEFLHEKVSETRFKVKERLWLYDPLSEDGRRYHKGFTILDSPIMKMLIAVGVIVIGILLFAQKQDYRIVDKTECIKYTGVYDYYYEDDYIEIYFQNGDIHYVDTLCAYDDFYEKMDRINKGQNLQLLIHPDNEYVVEIRCGGTEILNFKQSQIDMRDFAIFISVIGVILAIVGFGLLLIGFKYYKKERNQKENL